MAKKSIEEIKRELVWIAKKENVHSILIFGSYLSDLNPRDIDICIVTFGKPFSLEEYGELTLRHPNGYDFVVFEELPLYLKMEIINKHIILYSRDQYELYEYFYKYRKLWKDQEYRNRPDTEFILKRINKYLSETTST